MGEKCKPDSQELYKLWSTDDFFDCDTRNELKKIAGDAAEIEERFYKYLEFGTAGLRGIMGAGTNRMNIYTVSLASEAFARYIDSLSAEQKQRGLVISYDSRHNSLDFAKKSALVFAKHGIPVRLVDELRPTPMLSFAVRYYNCIGGVMITASHNPAKYNGYKAYGEDGGQMPPEAADVIMREMAKIEDVRTLQWLDETTAVAQGLLTYVGRDLDTAFQNMLLQVQIDKDVVKRHKDLKIVYTPLCGCGNKPVNRILKAIGFENVITVPEEEKPDGDFASIPYPNPEEACAWVRAIKLANKVDADLVIATDPDSDRTGLLVKKTDGTYQILSGNQIGLLLMEYILSAKVATKSLAPDSFVVTTIVSTALAEKIAASYGVKCFLTLTGFKYIGEKIKQYHETGLAHFVFGFEESFGFLAETEVRDKDAVVACMLISEMAAKAADSHKTVNDLLQDLFRKYGYGTEKVFSLVREGIQGQKQIAGAMAALRADETKLKFPDLQIVAVEDYLSGTVKNCLTGEVKALDMPVKSDVLRFKFANNTDFVAIRPSGTEPKLKVYCAAYAESESDSRAKAELMAEVMHKTLDGIM
jgi:hypothetical protein